MMLMPQDNQLIEYKLSIIQEDIESLKSDVNEMKGNINQILLALQGNPLVGSGGLSGELDKIKTKVETHEDVVKRLRWTGALLVFLGGIAGVVINLAIKMFSS